MTKDKVTTKKLLVAYDPKKPRGQSGDFLVPILDTGGLCLWGTRSKQRVDQGRLVYLGEEITLNDVVARLVDSGHKIESVERTLRQVEAYLRMLQDYRIGNILVVEAASSEDCGFRLRKLADAAPSREMNLP